MDFEYRRSGLFLAPYGGDRGLLELWEAGEGGWELIAIETHSDSNRSFVLRRQLDGGHSWEYHHFEASSMPGDIWRAHLSSCGWTLLEPCLHAYAVSPFYLAKRPDWYRGTDDGDILARLLDLGHPLSYMSKEREEGIRSILELKWLESEKAGHDIGTYEAVRRWLVDDVVIPILEQHHIPIPDDRNSLLDELLALRSAYVDDRYVPPLRDVITRWCELKGA